MTTEIKADNYRVWSEAETHTVHFSGSLRLSGMPEYAPIAQLLNEVAAQQPSTMSLNLSELEFLNSSGISMLSKFVISVRNQQNIQVVVKGTKDIPWQAKSLKNLQRLMPTLTLDFE